MFRPLTRWMWRAAMSLLTVGLAAMTLPAAAKNMFYVADGYGSSYAWYLVLNEADKKARLVGGLGSQAGTYTDNGTEILVTLNKPFSSLLTGGLVCNQDQPTVRHDVEQVLFRRVDSTGVNSGKSQVVEIGKDTILDTCKAGEVIPFGSLSDEGTPMLHRSAAKRAAMIDVVAGLTLAGLREEVDSADPSGRLQADIATLDSDTTVHFQRTGHVVNTTLTTDQWLVLQLPGGERGYTRVIVNASTGLESWIEADFKDGKPQKATGVLMVKPIPGASFGSKAEASRMWETTLFVGTNNPLYFYLYGNYNGEKISKDIAAADEYRQPITWRFDGGDIVQTRISSTNIYERRWTPLARTGKYVAVMESETKTPSVGAPSSFIPLRVNSYVDRGKATPPTP